jgi:hypothetical protein
MITSVYATRIDYTCRELGMDVGEVFWKEANLTLSPSACFRIYPSRERRTGVFISMRSFSYDRDITKKS